MLSHLFFFLMIPRPPRSTPFPYTTPFRSVFWTIAWSQRYPIGGATVKRMATGSQAPTSRSGDAVRDRKSTRLNSSHGYISYAVFSLKKNTYTLSVLQSLLGQFC